MLRVGLTGELGSGKSTVARLLAAYGAVMLSSDEMARALMEPGEHVHALIVERFGPAVLDGAGRLDRGALARLAFDPERPRVEELNALVHPAVLSAQERELGQLAQARPDAIAVIESALIFSVKTQPDPYAAPAEASGSGLWRSRFDCVVVVTAPRAVKIERYVKRISAKREISERERLRLEQDAERRLDTQAKTPVPEDVITLPNDRGEDELRTRVASLWNELVQRERIRRLSSAANLA